MASPFSVTPLTGADFNGVTLAADIANGKPGDGRLGVQQWGSNGRRYVYAQANAAIAAATAVASVSPTTFLATATGGTYLSPPVAMAVGDRGWFSAASV